VKRLAAVLLWLVLVAPLSALAQPMEPLHAGDVAKVRASFKGRPLVVHVWSLTCGPCLIELPQWAQRMQQNPGVAFVFINTDGTDHAASAARRLAASGVKPTRSLVYADDFIERLQFEIAPDWLGELPRTEWTSAKGKSAALLGAVSNFQFRQWLDRER
jgi:thiol-disulfide isomerase/thioredoxin